jgi:hypothetical protein
MFRPLLSHYQGGIYNDMQVKLILLTKCIAEFDTVLLIKFTKNV